MTFPLEFDLLMIEVCTVIQKKRQKKTKKKPKNKYKDTFVSYILLHRFFLLLGSSMGVRVRFLREMSYVKVLRGLLFLGS